MCAFRLLCEPNEARHTERDRAETETQSQVGVGIGVGVGVRARASREYQARWRRPHCKLKLQSILRLAHCCCCGAAARQKKKKVEEEEKRAKKIKADNSKNEARK